LEHNQIVAGIFPLIGSSTDQSFRWAWLALIWVAVSGCAAAQGTIVNIRSWGGGFGGTPESAIRFSCLPNIEGSTDETCQQFRVVLAAARQHKTVSSGDAMGITPQWLVANVDDAVRRDLPESTVPHAPAQIALFRSAFTDASLTNELVKYFCCHTDDYPHARIAVFGQNTGTISLVSDSQNVFMIPWQLEENGKRSLVNHRGIGDALYRILPKGFPNRDRIGGINLREKYSDAVLYHIRAQWDMAGSMNSLGARFQELNGRFIVVESSISGIGSVDTDGYGWWGKARLPSASVRGEIGFFFPMNGNTPPSLQAFNSQIDGLIGRVQSIPWLTRYITAHKSAHVELRFVSDRSLSVKARTDLIADLRNNGKPSVAGRVAGECASCVFLEIQDGPDTWPWWLGFLNGGWSRWIIFPNGDMLLWHYQGWNALGYPPTLTRSWDYYGWKSVGLVVRPNGTVSE
jgi:hypothetical protein